MLTAPYVHLNSKRHHGELERMVPDETSSHHGNMPVIHNNSVVSMVDYTNLYIKNLDPEVTSYDLFKNFKEYGRIVSARVMRDTITLISKGYGFVSFSSMEEANDAQQNMNGALINTKHIVVTFHTHKKPANSTKVKNAHHHQRLPQQHIVDYMNLSPPTTASSSNNNTIYPIYTSSQPSPPYSHHQQNAAMFPPQEPYIPSKSNIPPSTVTVNSMATAMTPHHHYAQNPWNETGFWIHNNNTKEPVSPFHYHPNHLPSMHAPNISRAQTQTTNASALVSPTECASPPLIDLSHPYYPSTDSASTVAPSQIQIQKIRDAISAQLKDYQQKDLNDLVDLIQSLKKRDLSLCLFNPMFLKQKIEEAYEALYLFQNPPQSTTLLQPKMSLLDESNSKMNLSAEQVKAATSILSSLEGMTLNKKKRVFGDIFFPFVRGTGVKHAPKVTIRLLDTVPLEELAYNMYDKPELTRKAQYIYNELYSLKSN